MPDNSETGPETGTRRRRRNGEGDGVSRPCSRLGGRELGTWIFDLDNTLYPASSNLFAEVERRMVAFISERIGIGGAAADRLRSRYFREHGTTLRGLMVNHGIDPLPFLDFVHDIDLSPLAPAPALAEALGRLKGRKIIFTNAPMRHVHSVLRRLGIEAHFEGVFDLAAAGYLPKPTPPVYEKLVRRFTIDPNRAVMIDDVARNLVPAAALGMATVWVRTGTPLAAGEAGDKHIHFETDDVVEWLRGVVAGQGLPG
jgi:putative hydrolase of the HAD superfamily